MTSEHSKPDSEYAKQLVKLRACEVNDALIYLWTPWFNSYAP